MYDVVILLFILLTVVSLAWIIDEWGYMEARLIEEHKAKARLDWLTEIRWSEMND